jgi:hypothetical protein
MLNTRQAAYMTPPAWGRPSGVRIDGGALCSELGVESSALQRSLQQLIRNRPDTVQRRSWKKTTREQLGDVDPLTATSL